LVYALALASFIALVAIPREWKVMRESDDGYVQLSEYYKSITILKPWALKLKYTIAFCSFFTLLALAVLNAVRKRIITIIIILITALCVFPFCFFITVFSPLSPWLIYNQIEGPDNNCYYFMFSSFLMGKTAAIGRLETDSRFTKTYEIIGATPGGHETNWASIIGPAGFYSKEFDKDFGQLYFSESDQLVCVQYENQCIMVYDLNDKSFWGWDENGTNDIEQISPFILISTNTKMYQPDIDRILSLMKQRFPSVKKGSKESSGYPRRTVLEEALAHPNKEVRIVAKQLLEYAAPKLQKDKSNNIEN
jgi:hypothetical protein